MSPRILFALCLSAVAVVMVSARDCSCPDGLDVCRCRPSAVRPPKYRKPCLDACSRCEQPPYSYTDPCIRERITPVSPAMRQSSRLARLPQAAPSTETRAIQPGATIPFSYEDHVHGESFYHAANNQQQENLMTAVDPVSLYLASKNAKTAQQVNEAKISYGFYKEPSQKEVQKAANVKEAALNTIAKKVLVLKQEPKKSKFSEDPVSCEEMEMPKKVPAKPSPPTYNDLGYTTYNSNPCPSPGELGYSQGTSMSYVFPPQQSRNNPFVSMRDSGYNDGSSLMYSFPPQESVQRYESRSSHRRSGETVTSQMSYRNY